MRIYSTINTPQHYLASLGRGGTWSYPPLPKNPVMTTDAASTSNTHTELSTAVARVNAAIAAGSMEHPKLRNARRRLLAEQATVHSHQVSTNASTKRPHESLQSNSDVVGTNANIVRLRPSVRST